MLFVADGDAGRCTFDEIDYSIDWCLWHTVGSGIAAGGGVPTAPRGLYL